MPKIVSNIATQSLGIFLRNAVFNRQAEGAEKYTFNSALKFSDGTEVVPRALLASTSEPIVDLCTDGVRVVDRAFRQALAA